MALSSKRVKKSEGGAKKGLNDVLKGKERITDRVGSGRQ